MECSPIAICVRWGVVCGRCAGLQNADRHTRDPNPASVETETRVEEAFVFVEDMTSEVTALSIKHPFSLIFGIKLKKYKG